ncbi:PREDICTED: vesicle transport v-SNARE 12-like [Brassica oleracea var. oleracea]|nr:PREDICTED: vesicle transport v-SNARE 12-like [Brassica oleracea var. oleracea]
MFMERLDQTRDLIRESRKTMMETEDLGVSALQDLSRHRQTLLHSHSKLDGVDEDELSRLSLSSFVVLVKNSFGEKASAIADADTIVNGSTASEA